jgi:hypothetical protein
MGMKVRPHVDKALWAMSRESRAGWAMCKLTKTNSAVLSWFLETEYVNAVTARGYAVPPRLDLPATRRRAQPLSGV